MAIRISAIMSAIVVVIDNIEDQGAGVPLVEPTIDHMGGRGVRQGPWRGVSAIRNVWR